jgi:hypothetical protein
MRLQFLRGSRKDGSGPVICVAIPAVLAAVLSCLPPGHCAERPTGSVIGNITNSSGDPIVGAKIMVLNLTSGVLEFATTDSRGFYRVNGLAPGDYKVRISAAAAISAVRQPVQIDPGANRRIDAHLQTVEPGQDGDTILASGSSQHSAPTGAPRSPAIRSISLSTPPLMPFVSNGDLWFTTWADDDYLYGTWGDGRGATPDLGRELRTDCGIVKFTGTPPQLHAEPLLRNAPSDATPSVDDKPSSVLFVDKRLYGQFHSPLGDARIGYMAYSDDHGLHWKRVGYYGPDQPKPENASPWTKDRNSPFRCMFLINMGKTYSLNRDGFVYALAIGREWNWSGGVYLARVRKAQILHYSDWEYFRSAIAGIHDGRETRAMPWPYLVCMRGIRDQPFIIRA